MEQSKILELVADSLVSLKNEGFEESCPIGIIDFNKWEWPQGVGLFGLYQYWKQSGSAKYYDVLIGWYKDRIKEGLPPKNVNTMAPMLTLACLYEETQNPAYKALCDEWAQWVIEEMPRTQWGGLQHIVSGEENREQLWDDTLFMTVLFLAKWGMVTGNQSYVDMALYQFLIHTQFLLDKTTGLWFHGWSFENKDNFAKALWARGNCWITAAIPEFLEITGLRGGAAQYLITVLNAQVQALAKCQDSGGMWHTLLDDPTSYLETSATAGFGYGILKAVRMKLIPETYRDTGEKALHAVIKEIDERGVVQQVSYGTGMGRDLDHYRNIPICPMAYGSALALLLLSEGMK